MDGRKPAGLADDARRRKVTSEALRGEVALAARALSNAAFNTSNVAIIATDSRGVIRLFNAGAERMLGCVADDVLNKLTLNDIPSLQDEWGGAEPLIETPTGPTISQGLDPGLHNGDGADSHGYIPADFLNGFSDILSIPALRDERGKFIGNLLIGTRDRHSDDKRRRKAAEKHLEQMEGRYRGLLEAAPDAMVVVNQSGMIVLLNVEAERQFGYRRDELLGQKVTDIIPEGFAERLIADHSRTHEGALAQQIGTGIELSGRRKDGREFPIEIMLSPLKSDDSVLVTAAIRNISVRKAAEKNLAQMEARYRGLLEAAPDAMVVVNQGGEIVLLNVQAEKQFGYRRDELLGQKVTNIIPEGFAERLIADRGRSEADALAQQIDTGIELSGLRKDKSEFPIEIMLSPLRGDDGVLVTAAIRNISVRRAAEKHLAQMESRYRGLLEAAPDAMVVVNQTGEIVLLNVQAEKQFGYRRDELVGQRVESIIPVGFAERLVTDALRSAEEALAQQIGTGIEIIGLRKDGTEFPIEIMLSPLATAEGILVTAAIRDSSIRKHLELLKDAFVSNVSHELRTPLTSIAGALGLLIGNAAGKMPDAATRLITIAHANSQRLVRLINDILDIEKIESGQVVFNLCRIDVQSLVEQAIEANRGFADAYGVRVRLIDGPAGNAVRADSDRLVQVVTNLLSNAIKFSPTGGEVTVAIVARGQTVHISVRDHGHGIPAAFRTQIFQKFAQADTTDARQKGGTGLGLSIAKQITTRLGGELGFDDAPGGGTIFEIRLPVWREVVTTGIELDGGHNAARVLFCAGDHVTATAVRERLHPMGCVTDFATTADAALMCASSSPYAAMVVDLDLPNGGGVDLLIMLRERALNRNTLIIAISDTPGRDDPRAARLNVLDWFAKPLDIDHLVEVLNKPIVRVALGRPLILHVDDDPEALRAVAMALEPATEVVSVDSIEGARRAIEAKRFDLAVLDIALGSESGLDLLPHLRDVEDKAIPVVVLSVHCPNLACDAQVQAALTKSQTSIDSLLATVLDHLALRSRAS